jgi:SAM-dependent methyltransferase
VSHGGWRERVRRRKAERALERQLRYQQAKAVRMRERAPQLVAAKREATRRVRALIEGLRELPPAARVLEVGSGAHGYCFFFGGENTVGVDPLAREYARLFPDWQGGATVLAARGERLPFADGTFHAVICDNVIDHAEDPAEIVRELARVLAPGGVLYFTVNTHHPLYAAASALHTAWNAAGLRFEIRPFADHTVHLTPAAARRLFDALPLRVVSEQTHHERATRLARRPAATNPAALLKRVFFKNALYELLAVREPQG